MIENPFLFGDNQPHSIPHNLSRNISHLTRRRLLLDDLQPNTCSYTCILDLLQGSEFLNELLIEKKDAPFLLPCLKRKPPTTSKFSQAVHFLQALSQSGSTRLLEKQEDPWLVLAILRNFLNNFSSNIPTTPVVELKCSCGSKLLSGDFDYRREPLSQKVRLKNFLCALCGQDMVPSPCFLPEQFFIRIGGKLRAGYFDEISPPSFPSHKINSWIQYNHRKKHFRCIKAIGRRFLVLDGYEN